MSPNSSARPRLGSRHTRAGLCAIVALAVLAATPTSDAAFPGSNGRIAFLSVRANGGLELYTVEPDGGGLRQLTQHSPPVYETPSWSPTGRSLAIISEIDGSVFIVDLESRRLKPLPHTLFARSGIAWSPDGRRLAYSSDTGGGDIWVANINGASRHRLTTGYAYDYAPAWSPSGREIAFTRSSGPDQLEIMQASGKGLHGIGRGREPSWSPNGRLVAFQVRPENGHSRIVVSRTDGRMRRTLVSDRGCDLGPPVWAHTGLIAFVAECGSRGPRLDVVDSSGRHRRTLLEGSFYSNISWSPDGKRFAYGDGTLRVAVVGGTSSAVFRIPPGADGSPAWSPDGKRIAATLNDNPSVPELLKSPVGSPAWSPDGRYLVGIQGEGADFVVLVDLLTNDESTIYTDEGIGYVSLGDPAWSPDGRLIAFSVLDSGEITFYDVHRGDFVDLGKTITGQDPAWSPDGTRLAYDTVSASHPDARSSVFTARPDGTAVKRIAVNASGPAWSPDGKEIVFVRSLDGNRELYVMRADGTEQRRLTFNAGLDTAPDWQPLPVTP